jgi:hypothetical protein
MIKRSCLIFTILAVVVAGGIVVRPQQPQPTDPQKTMHDSMQGMNERGDKVMGFDHTKTTHHFLLKANGGVIQIEANDGADTASRDEIRQHLGHIARMFGAGNFSAPMLIHAQNPPGTDIMKQLKAKIKYEFGENERGAFIRISTDDAAALKAIHEFLRFQIKEHMTGDPLDLNTNSQ